MSMFPFFTSGDRQKASAHVNKPKRPFREGPVACVRIFAAKIEKLKASVHETRKLDDERYPDMVR